MEKGKVEGQERTTFKYLCDKVELTFLLIIINMRKG